MSFVLPAARGARGFTALISVFLLGSVACSGPTPNRKRRDASDISGTGGFGDTGGTGGSFGTGGTFGTGGRGGTGGTGGTGGQKLDAAVPKDAAVVPPDADIDAAVVTPDAAVDVAVVTPDAGVDAAADAAVDAAIDVGPDVGPDLAADLPVDVAPDLSPTQQGLVGYWKFDETAGTSAFDSTATMNTGTLSGAVFSTGARFPSESGFPNTAGVLLDGVNDYVSFGTTSIPNLNSAITVSVWANYNSVAGIHGFVSLFNPSGTGCGLQIGLRGNELRAWKWLGVTLAADTTPPASGWHNVIYTFDGTTHTLYVDGASAGSSTTVQASCPVTQALAGAVLTTQEFFGGSLDDLRIYNRVISATEIALIAAGADPLAGPKLDAGPDVGPDGPTIDLTTGLTGYWKLDEGSGTTTADSSGNGNTGTIAGTPSSWSTGFPAAQFTNPFSLALDGTDDQVAVGVTNFNMLDQSRTVSLWFNYTAVPTTGNDTFFSVSNRSVSLPAGAGFQIGTRGSNVAVWALGATIYAMSAAPAAGWHHLVYTFDGTTHRLFIDGVQAGMGTAVSPNPQNVAPTEALIGNYLNGNERFTGRLDDIRIWKDRVLSQAEISALFAGQ
jgi:hypothetical protein